MAEATETGLVAECYWPGVRRDDLRLIDEGVEACMAELAREGRSLQYLGSMLMVDDEVVLCLFKGSMVTVQRAAERAGVPFERILRSAGSFWSNRAERMAAAGHTGVDATNDGIE